MNSAVAIVISVLVSLQVVQWMIFLVVLATDTFEDRTDFVLRLVPFGIYIYTARSFIKAWRGL